MKIISLFLTIVFSQLAFANLQGEYRIISQNTNESSCAEQIYIIVNSPYSIVIDGDSELGAQFSADGNEGSLEIKNINQGNVETKSSEASHGGQFTTLIRSVLKGDVLSVDLTQKEKYLFLTTSVVNNKLIVSHSEDQIIMKIQREYKETAGKQWRTQKICQYAFVH